MSRQPAPPPGGSRKISFNVSDQYDIQDVVGEGAYGVVWYVASSKPQVHVARRFTLTLHQLSIAQALGSESRYQENYPFRSFHVLPSNITRNEIASLLQP